MGGNHVPPKPKSLWVLSYCAPAGVAIHLRHRTQTKVANISGRFRTNQFWLCSVMSFNAVSAVS